MELEYFGDLLRGGGEWSGSEINNPYSGEGRE